MNGQNKITYEFSYLKNNKLYQDKGLVYNNLKNYIFVFNKYFKYKNYLHNISGSSFTFDKYKIYAINGKKHKLDGPAYNNGDYHGYYIDGELYSIIDFGRKTNHLICHFCNKFCKQKCFL